MFRKLLELLRLKKKVVETAPVKQVHKPLPKGKVIAKILYGDDIEFMYERREQNPGLCSCCHTALKKIPNLEYKIQKKRGDVFYTYDSFCVVTEKFKTFCAINGYKNLIFTPLPKSPGYYFFETEEIFRSDTKRSLFDFGDKQNCCGQYLWVTKGTFLHKDKSFYLPTDDFIYKLDYWLGSSWEKCPTIIIGLETVGKMKKYGISGIYFDDVME